MSMCGSIMTCCNNVEKERKKVLNLVLMFELNSNEGEHGQRKGSGSHIGSQFLLLLAEQQPPTF